MHVGNVHFFLLGFAVNLKVLLKLNTNRYSRTEKNITKNSVDGFLKG